MIVLCYLLYAVEVDDNECFVVVVDDVGQNIEALKGVNGRKWVLGRVSDQFT